jgi:hypothetical protein
MGSVTGQAIFHDWWMFPQERSPDIGVTFKALGVARLGVNQLVCKGSVGVVAIGTAHLALADGMVGLAQQLCPDMLMALPAGFFLTLVCKVVRVVGMNAVTAGAGKIAPLMFTAVP